jgi:hypothetical protein
MFESNVVCHIFILFLSHFADVALSIVIDFYFLFFNKG